MSSRLCYVVLFSLLWAAPAHACDTAMKPLADQSAAAAQVFVGTVTTVENGLATLRAEKSVKGIKDGQTLDFDTLKDACAIRFQPGQRWLYLGGTLGSGSQMIADEYGRPNAAGLAAATTLLGAPPPDSADLHKGRVDYSCAPNEASMPAGTPGYSAIGITLDNGYSAGVYIPLDALDTKQPGTIVSYTADGKKDQGHAVILQCAAGTSMAPESPKDQPCKTLQGTVNIGDVSATDVSGNVEIKNGEYHSRYVFRVTRTPKPPTCQ